MSMDRCGKCGDLVDTDDDPDAYIDDECMCEACRERLYVPCDTCGDLVRKSHIASVRGEPVERGGRDEYYSLCGRCR